MNQTIRYATLLLAVLWMAGRVYGQGGEAALPKKVKNNALEINVMLHEFFDRNPVMETRYTKYDRWTNHSYGLSYTRRLKGLHGLEAAFKLVGIDYIDVRVGQPKIPGWVVHRLYLNVDLLYARQLAASKSTELRGLAGVSFRYGGESQTTSWGGWHQHSQYFRLCDPGMTFGLRLTQALPWNFQVAGALKYTYYVFRYDKPEDSYLRMFTTGASQQSLTMQVGLGYRF